MTDRHRSFGAEHSDAKPLTFDLMGQSFTGLPEAPSGILNDLIAGIQFTPDGNRIYSAPNLIAFVQGVLIDEYEDEEGNVLPADDVERFTRLVHSKKVIVPIETLGDLVIWLSEEYGARPTVPSTRSARGRPGTGATSRDGSSSRASAQAG